ncbi:MAG: OmpH family outer membrane protein [Anaerolineae bacterium]|nr:OmpH family outer membrane protein [Gemmatimonadaceae bacterium]
MGYKSRSVMLSFAILGAFSAPAMGQAAAPKIVYLNSQQILAQAPGRAEAEAQFQKELATYQTQVKRMGDSLNVLVAAYNKQEVILSPAAKEAKQKELQGKEQEFEQRRRQLEQQAQKREADLTRPILDQIQKVINDMRTEEGYTFILDAGSTAGVVVAADKNLDVTEKVLVRLRTLAAAPKTGATRPATSTGPTANPSGATRPKPPAQR